MIPLRNYAAGIHHRGFVEQSLSDLPNLLKQATLMNVIRTRPNLDELAAIIDVLTEEYAGTHDPNRRKQLALEISSLAEAVSWLKCPTRDRYHFET